MLLPRACRSLSTCLALGLGLSFSARVEAQVNPSNANLSTGSGAGTSPGVNPGSSPSSTAIGNQNLRPDDNPNGGNNFAPPGAQPIVDPTTGLPYAIDSRSVATLSQEELDAIDATLLDKARTITQPAARAQVFERVARAKIYAHRLGDSHLSEAQTAIREGGQAAVQVTDPITRDLRLMRLIQAGMTLSDEFIREGLINTTELPDGSIKDGWSARRRLDQMVHAEQEREYITWLAGQVGSSNLRSELFFQIVDNESRASETIALAGIATEGRRSDLQGLESMIARMADRTLVLAANTSAKIAKPIWRDRSMVSIAIAAAASDQFDRGIQVSRGIPQPEYRSDALTRIAEAQARRNLGPEATRTYTEAAHAVASIPLEDPRSILTGVLIDSLISVGRFDDARACVPFFPDDVRKLNALGTIAESQGERRLASSALAWIERDAPPAIRDELKVRVGDGVLKAFENTRTNPSSGDTGTR